MLISIIIPVYNAEEFIEETIKSALDQSYANIEIICVNDGSTDKSYEILNCVHLTDNRIHVINQNNQGVSSARNTGLDHSKGDYIFFLDADDIISRDCIYNLLKVAQHSNAITCARVHQFQTKFSNLSNETSPHPIAAPASISSDEHLRLILTKKRDPYIWGKLFPRSVLLNSRFPTDLSYGEDLIYNALILSKHNIPLIDVDDAIYYYRTHNTSATATFALESIFSNIKKIALLRSTIDDYKYGAFISFLQISEIWTLTKKAIISMNIPGSDVDTTINTISLAYSSLKKIKPEHYLTIVSISPILPIMHIVNLLILSNIKPIRKVIIHILFYFYKITS